MRIYLGCGGIDKHGEGYKNADKRALQHVDIVCDAGDKLPFKDGELEEILADSLLEHLPHNDDTGNNSSTYHKTIKILIEWGRVLKSGGILSIKVPNLKGIFYSYYIKKTCSVKDFIQYIYGGEEYPENTHISGFDPSLLELLLKRCGFRDIRICNAHKSEDGLDEENSYEFRILARKK